QLARGDRADSVETAYGKSRDIGLRPLGSDDAESVRLVLVGGKLGDELAVADGGARRGLARFADSRAYVLGGGARRAETGAVLGHVEIGFVQAQRLDEVSIIGEDRS